MKHSRKMILLDYDAGKNFDPKNVGKVFETPRQSLVDSIIPDDAKYLANIDSDMDDVLNAQGLSDYEKIKLHNELLRRYTISKANMDKQEQSKVSDVLSALTGKLANKFLNKGDDNLSKLFTPKIQKSSIQNKNFSKASLPSTPKQPFLSQSGFEDAFESAIGKSLWANTSMDKTVTEDNRPDFSLLVPKKRFPVRKPLSSTPVLKVRQEHSGGKNRHRPYATRSKANKNEDRSSFDNKLSLDSPLSDTKLQTGDGAIKRWERLM